MAVFFTADTHFGHAAIIRHTQRPFRSAEQMDEALISRWNACVAPGDTVYHLGDFSFRAGKGASAYLDRLNGEIHLIRGNHDDETVNTSAARFASISDLRTIKVEGQRIVLFHYPMREWPYAYSGAWHLFGHVHGTLDHAPHGPSLDVGVDSHGYRPWAFAEIAAVLGARPSPFKRDDA
jgi:calcineurin-like phosphoesterase family protein